MVREYSNTSYAFLSVCKLVVNLQNSVQFENSANSKEQMGADVSV